MIKDLSKAHQSTYDAIFRHPLAHNLAWRDVHSMLAEVGEVVELDNGSFKTRCGGESIVLHPGGEKTLSDAEMLMTIRHFLKRAGAGLATAPEGTHLLVVIDHREARIFSAELVGSVPQKIVPYDPHGYGRALHYNQDDADGQRKPELKSFYEAVAQTLRGAEQILLFGTGTGSSSAMEVLLADLKKNHHEVAAKVIGTVAVDEKHLTEGELLAKAREMFGAVAAVGAKA